MFNWSKKSNSVNYRINTSVEAILKIVYEDYVRFKSVVDIKCGEGIWLETSKDLGAETILGFDIKVPKNKMFIEGNNFEKKDICDVLFTKKEFSKFDIALSLNVAETIPESLLGIYFVNLTYLSDVILFSSSIPNNTAVDSNGNKIRNAINKQWPSYWVKKFKAYGYTPIDVIRQKIWDREDIEWSYAQNIMFFVKDELLVSPYNRFYDMQLYSYDHFAPIDIVHPKCYLKESLESPYDISIPFLLGKIFKSTYMLIKKILHKMVDVISPLF